MQFWNNASTGMKVLIVVIIAAAVLALVYIVSSAFSGGSEEPTAPAAPAATQAPVATQTSVPTPKPSEPPVAVISGPTQTQVGQPVTLSAADSRAAEGSQIVVYQWDLGDGAQSTNASVTHIYVAEGRYDVKLTVTDNNGLDNSSTVKMEVEEALEQPTEEAPEQPALEDRDWMKMSVLQGTEITATFRRGKVSGSSGCNDYDGSYQVSGNAITISNLSSGRKTCEQSIMDQENAYLAALETATAYQVQGNDLTISTTRDTLQYLETGN